MRATYINCIGTYVNVTSSCEIASKLFRDFWKLILKLKNKVVSKKKESNISVRVHRDHRLNKVVLGLDICTVVPTQKDSDVVFCLQFFK